MWVEPDPLPADEGDNDELFDHFMELADEVGVLFVHRPTLCEDVWPDTIKRGETCGMAHASEIADGVPIGVVLLSVEPRTRVAYLMGLHELGHLATAKTGGAFQTTPVEDAQLEEARAWRWALAKAKFEPNACEWGEILWRMKTYQNKEFEGLIVEAERNATTND